MSRILVIKLGALGDFVQATGPMAAIRRHHAGAEITLLTTRGLADLAETCPFVDHVWYDDRPSLWNPAALLGLRERLRSARFARVYDLQTSDRSSFYFRLMGPGGRPQWSGIARGSSHPHDNPARDRMHTIDRQADQLRRAGIADVPAPDVSWAARDVSRFALPARYVLLVPGGSGHRPEKRWPVERYAELAERLAGAGVLPVALGGPDEAELGEVLAASGARNVVGQTGLGDVVGLALGAERAIGNDTGPMHLAVAAGCPATVLYSAASDPVLTAPRGRDVVVLRRETLATLAVEEVLKAGDIAAAAAFG